MQKKLPRKISPQLATLIKKAPNGEEWIHEMKFDGYRILSFIQDDIRLFTRGNHDWTDKFESIASELKKLKLHNTILDGEVVALDEKGLPNFQSLQNALSLKKESELAYYVFDILVYKGKDITQKELIARKDVLKKCIPDNSIIRYSDHIQGNGEQVFKNACKLGFEGIISKNIYSCYTQKRTRNWLKVKCTARQELVIGGFTKPRGERGYFGSLLLGYYQDKEFIYCGRVGTGFNQNSLRELHTLLSKYKITTPPFKDPPVDKNIESWVKPIIVAEIEFQEWTDDGLLRHSSFKGIRQDKPPCSIKRERSVR